MVGTFLKTLIPSAFVVAGGTALALGATGEQLAADLETRSTAALQAAGAGWAAFRLDGRDVIVEGTATDSGMIDTARNALAALPGVRAVSTDVILAEYVSPFPFSASVAGGKVTLAGGFPNDAAHTAILAAAGDVTDTTRLLSGGPDAALFETGAKFALAAAAQLDQGEVSLADLVLSVNGRAKSATGYGSLQALASQAPAGISVAAVAIAPPLVSPYVWRATFDGAALNISGAVPDAALEDQYRAASADVPVSTSLMPGSGEPQGFASNTLTLLRSLLLLENGEVSIADDGIALTGAPPTAAIAEEVAATLAALGGTVRLDPPRIADFGLALVKSAEAVTITGHVPDTATRDRLAALPRAEIANLALGRGAPERFASGLDYALDLLGLVAEGRVDLNGTRIDLAGRTGTLPDYRALLARAGEGAPQGFTLERADIRPPVADPFTFRAVKDASGAAFTGFLPADTARAGLFEPLSATATDDRTEPAEGAPDNFTFLAGKGLEVLALLETGTLAYDGRTWSIEGIVDTPQQGFAADAAYSAAGLRTFGFTYDVRQPAHPLIAPYTWRAQKAADGAVTIAGFAPHETFRTAVKARLPAARDTSALGAGAPADFEAAANAGLDALAHLSAGSVAFDGSAWVLTGAVLAPADGEAALAALRAGPAAATWNTAIDGLGQLELVTASTSEAPAAAPAVASSSEPLPADPAIVEVPAPVAEPEPVAEPASTEPEPAPTEPEPAAIPEPDRAATIVEPLPASFTFEASKESREPIRLQGLVAHEGTRLYFSELAGGASADDLLVSEGLPADFVANGATGLRALAQLNEGRLGFDGSRWWLRGLARESATRDTILSAIASQPAGDDWSVSVNVMTELDVCRDLVLELERRNAITFQSGSATLLEASLPIIDELAVDLNMCPSASVHVEGHTDSDGAEDLNLALSVARAETVVEALIQRGVDLERLFAEGYGESRPIADNDTAEGKARNRRIAFSISEE